MSGDNLNLKHKSVAPMKRVFVALAADGAEESPQVKAEATVGAASPSTNDSSKAAVGAQAAAGAAESAAEGPSNMDVDDDEDASQDNADQFLKKHIVPWLNQLEQNAVTNAYYMLEYLAAALSTSGGSTEELVQAFKEKVSGLPFVNFQSVPKHSKKMSRAHLHVVI